MKNVLWVILIVFMVLAFTLLAPITWFLIKIVGWIVFAFVKEILVIALIVGGIYALVKYIKQL